MGGYPGSNRELTVPHTVALPIELYLPFSTSISKISFIAWSISKIPFLKLGFGYAGNYI